MIFQEIALQNCDRPFYAKLKSAPTEAETLFDSSNHLNASTHILRIVHGLIHNRLDILLGRGWGKILDPYRILHSPERLNLGGVDGDALARPVIRFGAVYARDG